MSALRPQQSDLRHERTVWTVLRSPFDVQLRSNPKRLTDSIARFHIARPQPEGI